MHSTTEHYDVIHIYACKGFHASQLLIHEMLEHAKCIGKPEGHDFESEQAPFEIECCMMLVLWVDFNFVVALL